MVETPIRVQLLWGFNASFCSRRFAPKIIHFCTRVQEFLTREKKVNIFRAKCLQYTESRHETSREGQPIRSNPFFSFLHFQARGCSFDTFHCDYYLAKSSCDCCVYGISPSPRTLSPRPEQTSLSDTTRFPAWSSGTWKTLLKKQQIRF